MVSPLRPNDKRVPFLPRETIERDAVALLGEHEQSNGLTLKPPVPIEDIIEKHLKLTIDFDDVHSRFSIPRPTNGTILGLINSEGEIFISPSLDPSDNPSMEGRYHFTLAHECGHWRLHQCLLKNGERQRLISGRSGKQMVICRSDHIFQSGHKRTPDEEWQANTYASYILMPPGLILKVWREIFPDNKSRILPQEPSNKHPFVEIHIHNEHEPTFSLNTPKRQNKALERFCKPLAKRFAVSPAAMRIRLENIGLLHRSVPSQ